MLKRIIEPYQFESTTRFNLLPTKNIVLMETTTPSVLNNEYFTANDNSTVTDFLYGQPPQTIKILGNGTMTISNNANIKTNTGANKVLAANKVYTFTLFDIWYEDS